VLRKLLSQHSLSPCVLTAGHTSPVTHTYILPCIMPLRPGALPLLWPWPVRRLWLPCHHSGETTAVTKPPRLWKTPPCQARCAMTGNLNREIWQTAICLERYRTCSVVCPHCQLQWKARHMECGRTWTLDRTASAFNFFCTRMTIDRRL
jgi:hypothetical protein